MTENEKQTEVKKTQISLKNLYLDPNNYRLIHEPEYKEIPEKSIKEKNVQQRTFRFLAGDKNQNIQELIDSFKANNYLPVDQIQVRPLDNENYKVVEGNRRIAALKYLQTAYEEKRIDICKLDPNIFINVPVVENNYEDEMHYLTLMALKHISGNKKWGEWNQAKLLENMHSRGGLTEEDICDRIGISMAELRKTLRALSFLKQYLLSDYQDQFSESMFPIFREVVNTISIKEWLDWEDSTYKALNNQNRELFFSWISKEPSDEEEDDGFVQYGNKYHKPAIVTRADIRLLGKIIKDEKAVLQLNLTRDINAVYNLSDQIFYEHQQRAIQLIGQAISTLDKMVIKKDYFSDIESILGRFQGLVDRARSTGFIEVEQKTVFHDRIEHQFSEIHVIDYKRLNNFSLSKLSKINLITGINNSGKTTLLEAIYLLCRQNDFSGLLEIIRRRGKVEKDRLDQEWFIEQLPIKIEINGQFDYNKSRVQIRHYIEENTEIDMSSYLESVEISSDFAGIKQESLTRIYKERNLETQAGTIKMLCLSVFSSPFFLNESRRYTRHYYKSIQSKSIDKIIKFIKEKVVPTVGNIRLADEKQRFLVTDGKFDTALDLTEYGEGLQRIFFISLLFASAQNGVILIDEFENAIHVELISKFAEFIYDLSKLFNVQVFLTSHSKECIDAFVKTIPNIDELAVCALVETENGIEPREFSGERFKRLIEVGNVDLRRAR